MYLFPLHAMAGKNEEWLYCTATQSKVTASANVIFIASRVACKQAVRACVETYCYLGTEQMRRTGMDEVEVLYLQGRRDSLSQTTLNALLLCCLHRGSTASCPVRRHVLATSRWQRSVVHSFLQQYFRHAC